MDESVKLGARLEVSVLFGRFENDELPWEKWSSFSPNNKYLDEVGNLSTPGSVAQKKAYFEAHYKKIAAAKKAEESDQENSMTFVTPILHESCNENHFVNSSGIGNKLGLGNGEKLGEDSACEELSLGNGEKLGEDSECEELSLANGERLGEENAHEVKEDVAFVAKDELNGDLVEYEIDVTEEAMLVGVETPTIVKKAPKLKNGIEQSCLLKKENLKLKARKIAQKVTPISTPRLPKPTSIATPISASQKKKVHGSPLPKSNNFPVVESKRGAPLTQKSLIMEKMGDKDIVKRAFKSFQNRTDISSTAYKPKVSTSLTPRKEHEGLRKNVEKVATQRSQSRTMSKPLPSGPDKSCAVKNTKAASPSIGSRGDERSEKRKEFLNKLEAKSNAREAANSTKAKESVDIETCY